MQREIIPAWAASAGDDAVVPADQVEQGYDIEPETSEEADRAGPDAAWRFWEGQIEAALRHEARWRAEAIEAERLYFGPDEDPGGAGEDFSKVNRITDKVALVHATIDVLRPLLYSDTPEPVVRRRFYGDGRVDATALMAAEAAQRLARFFVDEADFDAAMEMARDDWLIAGRGCARVIYKAEIEMEPQTDDAGGEMMGPDGAAAAMLPVKKHEKVMVRAEEWSRVLFAPTACWDSLPWMAIEVPMTRSKVAKRFGPAKAEAITYNEAGLKGAQRGRNDSDRDRALATLARDTDTGAQAASPFDTVNVWEIQDKEGGRVVWWCDGFKESVLDEVEDPLGLEGFYTMPRPLLATTKGGSMLPRPDVKYYEQRAAEIDIATKKMKTILDAMSVSGLYPGGMDADIKKLLDGSSTMIPVPQWNALLEKGGSSGIIQWLPLDAMIAAVQALAALREQAKNAMFEASGVSDVMRAQGDPNETATAQQIKGRYAGLRLQGRQRNMAVYCRDIIRIMLEIVLEHFDTETIAEICSLDLPLSEAEREMLLQQRVALEQQYQQAVMMHQEVMSYVEEGLIPGPPPPPPEEPEYPKIPETSWELVHGRLRDDFQRKITVSIETQSTVLADEQADKEARIEFLSAFSTFVSELFPLMGTGIFDGKTVKELLLFGIHGFPKSRTLESLIRALPDEPQSEPPEDTAVTVAKIRAEVEQSLKQMDMQNSEANRGHEMEVARFKGGVDLAEKAVDVAQGAMSAPPPREEPPQPPQM